MQEVSSRNAVGLVSAAWINLTSAPTYNPSLLLEVCRPASYIAHRRVLNIGSPLRWSYYLLPGSNLFMIDPRFAPFAHLLHELHREEAAAGRLHPCFSLIHALQDRDREKALAILEKLDNVNIPDARGISALMVAAYRGEADICARLIERGADVLYVPGDEESTDSATDSALERAICSRDPKTLAVVEQATVRARWARVMQNRRRDQQGFDKTDVVLLDDAVRLGMLDLCTEMVSAGVPINGMASVYEHPLHTALAHGQTRAAMLLVVLGADPEAINSLLAPSELRESMLAVAHALGPPSVYAG